MNLQSNRQKAKRDQNKSRSESQIQEDCRRIHPDGKKKCCGCREHKSLGEFPISRATNDGLYGDCKICSRIRSNRLTKKRSQRSAKKISDDAKRLRPSGDKKCCDCENVQSISQFPKCVYAADGHGTSCKQCSALRFRLKSALRAEIRDDFRRNGCIICGFKDLRCIDLAHRKREDKLRDKNDHVVHPSQIRGIAVLMEELKSVDPKCANCHAAQTHEEDARKSSENRNYSRAWEEDRRLTVNLEKAKRGGCVDCKLPIQDRFWLFDFDHVRGEKIDCVASMIFRGRFTKRDILLETAKCDLRCKNCHRIVTDERRKKAVGNPILNTSV